jgi:hypothetical protein
MHAADRPPPLLTDESPPEHAGSDVAASMAASLASTSVALQTIDPTYSATTLAQVRAWGDARRQDLSSCYWQGCC